MFDNSSSDYLPLECKMMLVAKRSMVDSSKAPKHRTTFFPVLRLVTHARRSGEINIIESKETKTCGAPAGFSTVFW